MIEPLNFKALIPWVAIAVWVMVNLGLAWLACL